MPVLQPATIINYSRNGLPIFISTNGQLHNKEEISEGDVSCLAMIPASEIEGKRLVSFGQIIDGKSFVIGVSLDGSVVTESYGSSSSEGSGDSSNLELLTQFYIDPYADETHLSMSIGGEDKCLSFRENGPVMDNCNEADIFHIIDDCIE